MAMVIKEILEGAQVVQTNNGYMATRVFNVSDVEATGDALAYTAMQHADIPKWSQAHPTIPKIHVNNITAKHAADSPNIIIIECTYAVPTRSSDRGTNSKAQIEVGSSVTTKSTNIDADGFRMSLFRANTSKTKPAEKAFLAQIQVPQTVFKYTKKEKTSPQAKSKKYVGKTNADTFEGEPAGSWLCSSITGHTEDGGQSYLVNYNFILGPWNEKKQKYTWDVTGYYTGSDNLPIPDSADPKPKEGTEFADFTIYKSIPFAPLRLGGGGSTFPSGFIGV